VHIEMVRSLSQERQDQGDVNKILQELITAMPGTVTMEAAVEFMNSDSGQNGNFGTIMLNVGGTFHQVRWDTMDKFPKSRLQKLRYATTESEILALCDSFSLSTREFFFDRSPRIFENILGLYRKGELHLTESVCPRDFLGELDYWGLSALHLEPCCAYTLQRASWLLPIVDHGVDQEEEVDPFEGMCCPKLRNVVWKLFEDPGSSKAARILVIVSSLFLLASILMLILSTVPEFQEMTNYGESEETTENGTEEENYFFRVTEAIFVGWFTLEFLIRFVVSPSKFEFILSFMNVIDLLGILPFFVSLLLNQLSSQYSLEYIAKAAQIFRILRILRIFKLSRHITGLKTLGTTLRNSHRELLLLSMTVSMGMLIFAGLGYALEKDEPDTMFYTLPQTLYWAIITMTSTGYGDISPKTSAGKLVASMCAICGVLCITLPIPIIVANFNRYHDKVIIEEELNQVRKEQTSEWEMAKHHLKMAKKTPSSESLDRSSYTITTMLNGNGFSDPGGQDTKRRLSQNLLARGSL